MKALVLFLGMQWGDGEGRGHLSEAWGRQEEGRMLSTIRGILEKAGGCEDIVGMGKSPHSAPFIVCPR